MKIKERIWLKYLWVLTIPIFCGSSMTLESPLVFFPVIYAFLLIPIVELFIPPSKNIISLEDEKKLLADPRFDGIIYFTAITQFIVLGVFLHEASQYNQMNILLLGKITAMGLMCGVIGINVAHELGHRSNRGEQLLAKGLLLTSLYMHFFIEHNRGHHKYVGTPKDPATAKLNESLPVFWVRSIIMSYISAWRLESLRLNKKNLGWIHNEMIWYHICQAGFLAGVWLIFGKTALISTFLAAILGILLLETVNYIEHYGLKRKMLPDGHYEKARPWHSWDSEYVLGRLMLFELSRHADHHMKASKKYQALNLQPESPKMPTGYPGMMLIALIPPVWYALMNPKIKNIRASR